MGSSATGGAYGFGDLYLYADGSNNNQTTTATANVIGPEHFTLAQNIAGYSIVFLPSLIILIVLIVNIIKERR